MGASVSSNTAKAIAKVANSVSNSTNVTSNQVNSVQQRINFDDCYIDMSGDIDIKTASTMIAKSKQMVTALQQSHIQNDIAQKMLQSATSTVGALPMGGFAEANNFSSSFCQATSDVVNQLSTVANQYNYVDQDFSCQNSTFIGKNFLLTQNSGADFFSSQVVNNSQISDIANNISQSIEQKATATVQGMGAFLLIFAIIIAASGYAISKPLSSGGFKIVIASVVVIGIGTLIAFAFLFNWPPFFQKPDVCILANLPGGIGNGCSGSGVEGKADGSTCINTSRQTLSILPPLQYLYPLFDQGDNNGKTVPPGVVGNMMGMFVSRVASQSGGAAMNGGFNAANAQVVNQQFDGYWESLKGVWIDVTEDPEYKLGTNTEYAWMTKTQGIYVYDIFHSERWTNGLPPANGNMKNMTKGNPFTLMKIPVISADTYTYEGKPITYGDSNTPVQNPSTTYLLINIPKPFLPAGSSCSGSTYSRDINSTNAGGGDDSTVCCPGYCSPLVFSFLGGTSKPANTSGSSTAPTQATNCIQDIKVTEGTNDSMHIKTRDEGTWLHYQCPYECGFAPRTNKDGSTSIGCGCLVTNDNPATPLSDGSGSPPPFKNLIMSNPVNWMCRGGACGDWLGNILDIDKPSGRCPIVPSTEIGTDGKTLLTEETWNRGQFSQESLVGILAELTQADDIKVIVGEDNVGPSPASGGVQLKMTNGWKARFLRSILGNALQMGTIFYTQPSDVVYLEGAGWTCAKTITDKDLGHLYQIEGATGVESRTPSITGYTKGSQVTVTGTFGICNDQQYKFNQFINQIGIYIMLGIGALALIFLVVNRLINRSHGYSGEDYVGHE